jgi:hypothetical protein
VRDFLGGILRDQAKNSRWSLLRCLHFNQDVQAERVRVNGHLEAEKLLKGHVIANPATGRAIREIKPSPPERVGRMLAGSSPSSFAKANCSWQWALELLTISAKRSPSRC